MKAETRRSNASLFGGDADRVPREALSMGMATILHARRILLIATGKSKAPAIRGMVAGPITPKLPASFLELHGNVDLWLDGPAASQLPERAADYFVFSSSLSLGSMSSPMASRTESSAFFSRFSACGLESPVFCITIAAFTFQPARLSNASAVS